MALFGLFGKKKAQKTEAELFEESRLAYEMGDLKEALRAVRGLAIKKNVEAQYQAGKIYLELKEERLAKYMLEEAAIAGHEAALKLLKETYGPLAVPHVKEETSKKLNKEMEEKSVKESSKKEETKKMVEQTAGIEEGKEAGFETLLELGTFSWMDGKEEEAFEYFQSAYERMSVKDLKAYIDYSLYTTATGIGAEPKRAKFWLYKGVEAGWNKAMFWYGYLLEIETGTLGVRYSPESASNYYREAAELGMPVAKYKYARFLYMEALDSPDLITFYDRDMREAFSLFNEAADDGHVYSLKCLAIMYYKGHGVKKNSQLALDFAKQYIEFSEEKYEHTPLALLKYASIEDEDGNWYE